IDLVKATAVSSVKVHTMEQNGAWIYLPASIEVLTSKDGKIFTKAGSTTSYEEDNSGLGSSYMKVSFSPHTVRYIRVIAKNYGKIPENEPGAGNMAWLFIDELQVF
ncbi:MAG TPA: hypothetical protein VD996_18315, partial [Chitinophagaceae bacterium]|nr:hypothetical protein [Chitinophagaceae bacterium]